MKKVKKIVPAKWDKHYQATYKFKQRNRINKAPEKMNQREFEAHLNAHSLRNLEKLDYYFETSESLDTSDIHGGKKKTKVQI